MTKYLRSLGPLVCIYGVLFGLPLFTGGRITWLSIVLAAVVTYAAVRHWLDPDLKTHDEDIRPHYKA